MGDYFAYRRQLECDEETAAADEAERRYSVCVHADACDRACDMHGQRATYDWLRCEECEVFDSEHCPMSMSGTMRCEGPR